MSVQASRPGWSPSPRSGGDHERARILAVDSRLLTATCRPGSAKARHGAASSKGCLPSASCRATQSARSCSGRSPDESSCPSTVGSASPPFSSSAAVKWRYRQSWVFSALSGPTVLRLPRRGARSRAPVPQRRTDRDVRRIPARRPLLPAGHPRANPDGHLRAPSGWITAATKAEVRAALGTQVAQFVTELTASRAPATEDEEREEEVTGGHPLFAALAAHYQNRRKSHRQVCDQLLNEYLAGRQEADFNLDHHWETLTSLYRTYQLTRAERTGFRAELGSFKRRFTVNRRLSTALNNPNTISTWYRVWRHLSEEYALPRDLSFGRLSEEFEALRKARKTGGAFQVVLRGARGVRLYRREEQGASPDPEALATRTLPSHATEGSTAPLLARDQKYVIWYRAGGQCEWVEEETRCPVELPKPPTTELAMPTTS